MLGVSHTQVQNDLRGGKKLPLTQDDAAETGDEIEGDGKKLPPDLAVPNGTPDEPDAAETGEDIDGNVPNGTPDPDVVPLGCWGCIIAPYR